MTTIAVTMRTSHQNIVRAKDVRVSVTSSPAITAIVYHGFTYVTVITTAWITVTKTIVISVVRRYNFNANKFVTLIEIILL